MFAVFAFIAFVLGLIFSATGTDTGDINMELLGLALFALHFIWEPAPVVRRP